MTRISSPILVLISVLLAPAPAAAQRAVILVRHAERVDESDGSALTDDGAKRAEALSAMLAHSGIRGIYTSKARRSIDTAAPLAMTLGITPVAIDGGDVEKTFKSIVKDHSDDVVLVVGHSNTVPDLVRKWSPSAAVRIELSEFDKIFFVLPKPGGEAAWVQLRYWMVEP